MFISDLCRTLSWVLFNSVGLKFILVYTIVERAIIQLFLKSNKMPIEYENILEPKIRARTNNKILKNWFNKKNKKRQVENPVRNEGIGVDV